MANFMELKTVPQWVHDEVMNRNMTIEEAAKELYKAGYIPYINFPLGKIMEEITPNMPEWEE